MNVYIIVYEFHEGTYKKDRWRRGEKNVGRIDRKEGRRIFCVSKSVVVPALMFSYP